MSICTSKKIVRKGNRKQKRSQYMILRETGINISEVPTKNIVICNAGLVSCLTQEALLALCLPHGSIRRIVMLPGQSFCFVQFSNILEAEQAFFAIHGKACLAQNEAPLYLNYSTAVPESDTRLQYTTLPPGLTLITDILSKEEEYLLLSLIDWTPSVTTQKESLKHRQVKHFGYEFSYETNNVDKNAPLEDKIPEECKIVWENLMHRGYTPGNVPDQLTVNKYNPGQGIPPHIDTHSAFKSPIISLSLMSDIVMEFRNQDGAHYSVLLPQRSLLIMDGEARYAWTHGITPRTMDTLLTVNGLTVQNRGVRTSFTFRNVLQGDCECQYTDCCDSYDKRNTKPEAVTEQCKNLAADLESTHVHQVYEQIASHFSDTRHKPWPNVLNFVNCLKAGSVLVDIGCGNGKYLGHNANNFEMGCDRSTNLAGVCNERGFQVFTCDCLSVPLRDDIADAVISIAVIHHLASERRRLQAIEEIVRILRIGGQALIYVWAKDQKRESKKSNYLKKKDTVTPISKKDQDQDVLIKDIETNVEPLDKFSLPIHINRTQFQHQDLLVPWKLKPQDTNHTEDSEHKTFLRYYHVYEENELETTCKNIQNIKIVKRFYDQGNWCLVLEKV